MNFTDDLIADDLVAVRTLLILKGRAVGCFVDMENHRICLVEAINSVCSDDVSRIVLCNLLCEYIPDEIKDLKTDWLSSQQSWLAIYNDKIAKCDQDVYDLIDKALADLGAL